MKQKRNKTKWRPTKLDVIKFIILVILTLSLIFFYNPIINWISWLLEQLINFINDCFEGKYTFDQVFRGVLIIVASVGTIGFGLFMVLRKRIVDLISEDTKPWNEYRDGKLHNEFPTRQEQLKIYPHYDINNYHSPGIIVDYEEVTTITILGIKFKR